MITSDQAALECVCGALLVLAEQLYLCHDCGKSFCSECGGVVAFQGGCSCCLSCGQSVCHD
jgi:hypothetical protein